MQHSVPADEWTKGEEGRGCGGVGRQIKPRRMDHIYGGDTLEVEAQPYQEDLNCSIYPSECGLPSMVFNK